VFTTSYSETEVVGVADTLSNGVFHIELDRRTEMGRFLVRWEAESLVERHVRRLQCFVESLDVHRRRPQWLSLLYRAAHAVYAATD
jgi:hypothetical protein